MPLAPPRVAELKWTDTKMALRLELAIAVRVPNGTKTSLSLVITTRYPLAARTLLSRRATSRVMSFSETLWPGIPPRSYPPCPASITTFMGELPPPELLLLFAAYELYARNVVSRPAPNKGIRKKFLRITGCLWARPAGALKVLVPCYPSSSQALRQCRRARLFRRYLNEQGVAAFWFP